MKSIAATLKIEERPLQQEPTRGNKPDPWYYMECCIFLEAWRTQHCYRAWKLSRDEDAPCHRWIRSLRASLMYHPQTAFLDGRFDRLRPFVSSGPGAVHDWFITQVANVYKEIFFTRRNVRSSRYAYQTRRWKIMTYLDPLVLSALNKRS